MAGLMSNIDVVEGVYAAMGEADLDGVLAHCAPDVTITQAAELPWGGRFTGRDGLIDFVTRLITNIDSKVTAEGLFEAGDRVIQRGMHPDPGSRFATCRELVTGARLAIIDGAA